MIQGSFRRMLIAQLAVTAAGLSLAQPVRAADGATMEGQPLPTRAGAFTLKLEPGLAIALTDPQAQRLDLGGGATLKALWALNRHLDIGPSLSFMGLPVSGSPDGIQSAWTWGAGARVKRPHDLPDDDQFHGVSPWADADLLFVRTGELNRPGFALAVGAALPLDKARVFWLGPFVRYTQIIQLEKSGFDDHDAKLLSVGLSLEVGSGVEREHRESPVAAAAGGGPINEPTAACADRDVDGIVDAIDHCPDLAGPMDFWGCPAYKRIVVGKDKLELKEKLFFAWDQAVLEEVSFPVLDEVVQALKENKGFRVQVEGHSSSEGNDDHNQTLSEKRASAVLDYLVAHGIGRDRLVSKGFSSSVPTATNTTVEGREANRRVDFVVQFNILAPPK